MNKDNKIISFEKWRRAKFELRAQISIHILRQDKTYTIEWHSPDEKLSKEDIYLIQQNVLFDLSKEVKEIEYKERESYEIKFTLLYYEKSKRDFNYICIPQDIKKEKLTEYLFVSTKVYELKRSDTL